MAPHPYPVDLLEAQTCWYLTYARLADPAEASGAAAHRRRLLQLSRRIAAHPYWESPAGTPAARVALKELARTAATGESA